MKAQHILSLAGFMILVVGGGLIVGSATFPGAWYAGLQKPWFNPPGWVFGPVWTLLYVLIAIVGWRTFRRNRRGTAMTLWGLQLALNFLWSPVFFGLQSIGGALAVVALLFATVVVFVVVTRRVDPVSSALFAPYAVWVGFAALLNAAIFALN